MPKNALITGASSGIGQGLARELAQRGWSVALLARRAELMEGECAALRAQGRKAVAIACDVTDGAAVETAVRQAESALGGPIDLAIANAGVSAHFFSSGFDTAAAENTIKVNVLGMIYLFGAIIPSMVQRRSGHFVGIGSMAGYRGLPGATAYSASKAAVQAFLEGSRIDLAPRGVAVTTVNPGYIRTPMTASNRFWMPFLMNVDEAVQIIVEGIEQRRAVVDFPLPMAFLMRIVRLIPRPIYAAVTGSYLRRYSKAGK